MLVKKTRLTATTYRTDYSSLDENGSYGLQITEYRNGVLDKQRAVSALTNHVAEIERVVELFSECKVFAIHVDEILEDLGYSV